MSGLAQPEVFTEFVAEAERYLPALSALLPAFAADPVDLAAAGEFLRMTHTIKGVAGMLDLRSLSDLAGVFEPVIEGVCLGRVTPEEVRPLLEAGLLGVERSLADLRRGVLDHRGHLDQVNEVVRPVRAKLDALAAAGPPGPSFIERFFRGDDAHEEETPPPAVAPEDDAPSLSPELPAGTDGFEVEAPPPELVQVFALEAEDHIRAMRAALAGADQNDPAILRALRRSAHTLKGSAAMVGLGDVTRLAHRLEDVLDRLAPAGDALGEEVRRTVVRAVDALDDMAAGQADAGRIAAIYRDLGRHLGAAPAGSQAPADVIAPPLPPADPAAEESPVAPAADHADEAPAAAQTEFVRVPLGRLDEVVKLVSELVICRSFFEQQMTDFVRQLAEFQPTAERLRRLTAQLEIRFEAAALGGNWVPPAAPNGGPSGAVNGDTGRPAGLAAGPPVNRLPAHDFDDLEFDRYSEFHLLSRGLVESAGDVQAVALDIRQLGDFEGFITQQARLTTEIEDKLRRLRMLPVAALSGRLHRTVRNAAESLRKEVRLVIEGESTELDKTVLDALADPLLHLLRNAVDHGLEPPEDRRARGKPAVGTVRLRAAQRGGLVEIQVSDDGRGVDTDAVRRTAVARGLVTQAEADRLSPDQIHRFLFRPGFSTAGRVTEFSGRGVGLDVVRTDVARLKGVLSLDTVPGQGTTFVVRLPLTLALTRALFVETRRQRFAVPLNVVTQIIRFEDATTDRLAGETVLRLGDRTYPLHDLAALLALPSPPDQPAGPPPGRRPVLIVDIGPRQVALAADKLLGAREVVIKSLSGPLRSARGIAGATLMGDGGVVLILNPAELIDPSAASGRGADAGETAESLPGFEAPALPARAEPSGPVTVLIVDDSPSVRRVLSTLIRRTGWNALTATDGLDALHVLQETPRPPDVLLLDVEMPRMDGYELLSRLRSQQSYRALPTVFVTSRAGEKHRQKALEQGANDYVVKPIQNDTLVGVIRRLVAQARSAGRPVPDRGEHELASRNE